MPTQKNTTFALNGTPFIELNKLLKIMDIATSGGEANQLILEGNVKYNGETELRKRKKLFVGDTVSVESQQITIAA